MREIDAREAERLVNTYSDLILRLSYTYLKSTQDGEDICQGVLLKLLTEGRTFDSPEHEKAWVVRTAINACKAGGGDGPAGEIPGGHLPLLLRGVLSQGDRSPHRAQRGGGVRPSQPGAEKAAGHVRRRGI